MERVPFCAHCLFLILHLIYPPSCMELQTILCRTNPMVVALNTPDGRRCNKDDVLVPQGKSMDGGGGFRA